MHRGPDLAALDRWGSGSRVARDQQQNAVFVRDCIFQRVVDRSPGLVEVASVKV